jgi:hypothetical protein
VLQETFEHAVPHNTHWIQVNEKAQLSEEQQQQLLTCFQVYTVKRAALIADIKQQLLQLQQLTQQPAASGVAATGVSATATASGSAVSESDITAAAEAAAGSSHQTAVAAAAAAAGSQPELQPAREVQTAAGAVDGNVATGTMACIFPNHSSLHRTHSTPPSEQQQQRERPPAAIREPAAQTAAPLQHNSSSSADPSQVLAVLEQQDQLLRNIQQGVSLLQSLEMFLSLKWMNTLSKHQLAQATVAAHPFLAFPASCECTR